MKNFAAILSACAISVTLLANCTSTPEKVTSAFKHEQQFLVDAVGKDIAQIALFAATKNHPNLSIDSLELKTTEKDRTNFDYKLKWSSGSVEQKMPISEYVWNPKNYTDWVKALCTTLELKSSKDANNSAQYSKELIAKLADFSTENIKENNSKIAEQLGKTPLDAETNEQAALLCMLYGLREAASCFSDLRPWLNRACTHLAIAEYARQGDEPGAAGKLSKAIFLALAGRQSDSLAMLPKLEAGAKDDETMKSWLRAIKMRSTHDYRLFDKKKSLLVEKLEFARALSELRGADALTDYLRENKPGDGSPDWIRIGARGGRSVEAGHIYTENSVSMELDDAAKDIYFFKNVKAKDVNEVVNEMKMESAGCMEKTAEVWHPVPISWANISAFHNRHTLDAVYQTYDFFQNYWGVKEEAEKLQTHADQSFSSLPLYPLVKMSCALAKDNKKPIESGVVDQLSKLSYQTPEMIPFYLWHRASSKTPAGMMQDAEHWFDPICPGGTAFDFDHRRPTNLPDLEAMLTLAPYDRVLLRDYARKKFKEKKAEDVAGAKLEKVFAPIIDYDVEAMDDVSRAYWAENDMDGYAKSVERTCKYDPNSYLLLGQCYENKDPKKAVAAYESGVKLARNVVLKSNSCYWLCDYYFDHGQKQRAQELAEECGECGSHGGFTNQAHIYERMGDLAKAEKVYTDIKERYDMSDDLNQFYARHMNDKPEYKEKADKYIKQIFPNGLKKYDQGQGAPKVGVIVQNFSLKTNAAGINVDDIIVAVNGWEVGTEEQFKLASQLRMSPEMEYLIWDEDKLTYRTAKLNSVDHRIGSYFEEFKG